MTKKHEEKITGLGDLFHDLQSAEKRSEVITDVAGYGNTLLAPMPAKAGMYTYRLLKKRAPANTRLALAGGALTYAAIRNPAGTYKMGKKGLGVASTLGRAGYNYAWVKGGRGYESLKRRFMERKLAYQKWQKRRRK